MLIRRVDGIIFNGVMSRRVVTGRELARKIGSFVNKSTDATDKRCRFLPNREWCTIR